MNIKKSFLILVLSFLAATVQATSKQWMHLHVENPDKQERVQMNIPLSLVETMLPLIEEKRIQNGKIRLNEKDIRVEDLRRIWKEIREAGDNEFLSVQNRDANIRVYTEGNYLMVKPEKGSRKDVHIQIPLAAVDAMLSGEGEELNLAAAVQALQQSGVRDIITIKSEDSTVQVWIDESNKGRE